MSESTALPAPQEPDRKCVRCQITKPADAFNRKGFTPKGRVQRRNLCAVCRPKTRARFVKESPENRRGKESPETRRIRRLKYEYNISAAQFDALEAAQDGRCLICGERPKNGKRLHIDHCHESGVVRSLLCTFCNTRLGVYEVFHETAAKYLAEYGQGNPLLAYDGELKQ